MSFSFNPSAPGSLNSKPEEIPMRTPISGSQGYISFVDSKDEKFMDELIDQEEVDEITELERD